MKKIVVIGSLNMDFSINVDRSPEIGETVFGNCYSLVPGGKGANQAYAIGKLGGNVSMLGAVGNDSNGKKLIKNLSTVNVDTSHIEIIENVDTGCAFVNVEKSGDNRIVVIPGANNCVTKEIIDKNIEVIQESDAIIMQLEIPIETVKYVIDIANDLHKLIIIDPAPAKYNILDGLYDKIDFIKPNETELKTLTGINTSNTRRVIKASNLLVKMGVKNILVTLGESGAYLINEGSVKKYDVPKIDVVDTTAAGDTFLGTFTMEYLESEDLDKAISKANKVASIVCTRKGAQSSIPTKEEVDNIC